LASGTGIFVASAEPLHNILRHQLKTSEIQPSFYIGDTIEVLHMKKRILLLTAGLVVISIAAFGHHGTGIAYDQSNSIVLKGTVTEFGWKNPHAQLFLDTKDADGNIQHWAVEMNSPGVMQRQGSTRRLFKPGDEVSITVHPSKAGTLVGECIGTCKVIINGKDATPSPAQPGEQF